MKGGYIMQKLYKYFVNVLIFEVVALANYGIFKLVYKYFQLGEWSFVIVALFISSILSALIINTDK